MLCVDALPVVLTWTALLARTHQVHVRQWEWLAMGLATWLVYLVDRTADAMSGRLKEPLSVRHAFWHQHWRFGLCVALPAGLTVLLWVVLWRLPLVVVHQGLVLGLLSALYLGLHATHGTGWLHAALCLFTAMLGGWAIAAMPPPGVSVGGIQGSPGLVLPRPLLMLAMAWICAAIWRSRGQESWRRMLSKEVLAALLLALGCAVPVHAWSVVEHGILCRDVVLVGSLFWLNLVSISGAEKGATGRLAGWLRPGILAGLCVLLGLGVVAWHRAAGVALLDAVSVCVLASSLLLAVLQGFRSRVTPAAFHLLVDGAVLLPGLLWLARDSGLR